jgi:hypothetical protein
MSQQKLDYQTPLPKPRRSFAGIASICVVSGVLVTPIAMFLAIASGGAGHGNYGFARLLFPYSMLLTLTVGNTITNPLIVLAMVQFPIYGMFLARSALASGKSFFYTFIAIGTAHLLAAGVCFSGMIPNFS